MIFCVIFFIGGFYLDVFVYVGINCKKCLIGFYVFFDKVFGK